LAGKIDNTAYDAAVAKAATFVSHEDEVRSQLNRILVSNQFCGSRRCQEFLFHVVDRALKGKFSEIKERLLGISLFGRDVSYDTNSDAIVRVTANDVRKRLRRYNDAAPEPGVRIELPSGSYIPEFHYIGCRSASLPVDGNHALQGWNRSPGNSALERPLEVVALAKEEAVATVGSIQERTPTETLG
jgi:hypothetical protein